MKIRKRRVIAMFACLQMLLPNHVKAADNDDLFLKVKETALGINNYSLEYDLNEDGKTDVFDVIRVKQKWPSISEKINKIEADITSLKELYSACNIKDDENTIENDKLKQELLSVSESIKELEIEITSLEELTLEGDFNGDGKTDAYDTAKIKEVCLSFSERIINIETDLTSLQERISKTEKEVDLKNSFNRTTAKIFKKVVCCGDSYTSGVIQLRGESPYQNDEYAWPHYMETATGNEWVNCGAGGCNVLTWQKHARGLTKAQSVGRAQAYIVSLMINDVSNTDRGVPLGNVEDIGTEAQTYYGGMSKIIRELNVLNPTAKIFVNTCPKTGAEYTQYNQAVRNIVNIYSKTYPVHCIDLEEVKDYYENTSLTDDYVSGHYTALGYEQFAEIYMYVLSDYINNHVADFQDVFKIPYDK